MNYIDIPNIPYDKVALAIVDGRIGIDEEKGLEDNGIKIIKTKAHPSLYDSVAFHPDMFLHHLGGRKIVYAPGTLEDTVRELEEYGFQMIRGETELKNKYPGNIFYNAARVGRLVFHNTKYTDKVLKDFFLKHDLELVHVNQGYAKCAISVVDENSIITMDKGIAKIADKRGLDVLTVEERNILLPGLDYGLIGGSSGLIDKDKWAVTGNFEKLGCYMEIQEFLNRKGKQIVSLSHRQVVDLGSLIPICSY